MRMKFVIAWAVELQDTELLSRLPARAPGPPDVIQQSCSRLHLYLV